MLQKRNYNQRRHTRLSPLSLDFFPLLAARQRVYFAFHAFYSITAYWSTHDEFYLFFYYIFIYTPDPTTVLTS